jgi:hypothetical protein
MLVWAIITPAKRLTQGVLQVQGQLTRQLIIQVLILILLLLHKGAGSGGGQQEGHVSASDDSTQAGWWGW